MESIWHAGIEAPTFPTLQGDRNTEVLIIGGGIAGILTAYLLAAQVVPYLLVEKERICGGTTQNTTAKLTVQHGLCYEKLLRTCGMEVAKSYLHANQQAFQKLSALCKTIPCDYENKDNFVYALQDRRKLERELAALHTIGYPATLREDLPIPCKTVGAVCFPDQAQFHPLKLLYAVAKNLHIYEHTFVRELVGNTAITDRAKIHAKRILVTTHFPFLNKHGGYFVKLYQHRSYVLALKHAQQVDGMYVDESQTGLSFRNYGDFLLLGGGAHRTGKQGGNWNALRGFAAEHYPHAKEAFFWAAQDCMSLDGMPYVGQYAKSTPRLYVASGFNKWGMTGAMLSAMLLTDLVTGTDNPFAETFNPSRSIWKPQLLRNGLESTKNLLTPSRKRCPHLGCALKWNSAEQSWDCPCHGSRFSDTGKVLDNPANGDLHKP